MLGRIAIAVRQPGTTMRIDTNMKHEHVTVRHGYWFYFDDAGLKITAYGSGMSGKEIIYAGEDAVSTKRAMRIRSKHAFDHGGHHYEVEFVMKNIWTGELECVLSKDGAVLERATKAYLVKGAATTRKIAGHILQGVLFGLVLSYLLGKFVWK
jgi:hypothetical protein